MFFKRKNIIDPRRELINDTVNFLLQIEESRFNRLLLAQLLDEGCNYPLPLARASFNRQMISGMLADQADPSGGRLKKLLPPNLSELTHPHFYEAIRFYLKMGKNSELKLARLVLDGLEAVKNEWQREIAFFDRSEADYKLELEAIMGRMAGSRLSPEPAAPPAMETVRARLCLALTTVLLRHTREPRAFHDEFGLLPQALQAMRGDHAAFRRAMVFFHHREPHFTHLASQTFWRTLQTLFNENREPASTGP